MFAPEVAGLDREAIRGSYNGYSWLGAERVYNPYDILLLFRRRKFDAYWFETGTPTFLVDTLFERRVSSLALDGMVAGGDLLSAFDVDDMAAEALLFYLTIRGRRTWAGNSVYRLGYPNQEVRQSLNRRLLRRLVGDSSRETENRARLYRLLEDHDVEGSGPCFHAFFAGIPHEWYANNDIARYEGY